MFNKIFNEQKARLKNEINELTKNIETKTNEINQLNSLINQANSSLAQVNQNITTAKHKLKEYQNELMTAEGTITMQELGMDYEPVLHNLDAIACKKAFAQESIGELIGRGEAIITTRVYRIDGSEAKGRQFQKAFCENLLSGFNSYFVQKKKAITTGNITKTKELITKKFNAINKKAALMGVAINQQYLNLCLEIIRLELDQKIAKTEERERIKEEKHRLKEQENLLVEAEKAKAELQKQRRMYEQSLTKALTEQERLDFEAKLKEIDKREADVDYRISNQKAGYLYIASTQAMPELVKIGATRRLNPLVRLQELSSASVPYPYKCYGLVFSDDVFDLEKKIHDYFDSKRFGLNKHKEFFKITPREAIKALKEEFNCDVHFVNEEENEEET